MPFILELACTAFNYETGASHVKLGLYDGAWYTEYSGTICMTISQILMEWDEFLRYIWCFCLICLSLLISSIPLSVRKAFSDIQIRLVRLGSWALCMFYFCSCMSNFNFVQLVKYCSRWKQWSHVDNISHYRCGAAVFGAQHSMNHVGLSSITEQLASLSMLYSSRPAPLTASLVMAECIWYIFELTRFQCLNWKRLSKILGVINELEIIHSSL